MINVDVSDKIKTQTEVHHHIIWGMPSRQQLQEAANSFGFTVVIFTCGNEHIFKTNQLLQRKLDSLQVRKDAVHTRRMLKHYILVYSAPPFNDRQAAKAYFAAIFSAGATRDYKVPASTCRGRLNLLEALL